ncbi:hypothetical protein PT974_09690 [Cladobotryum mycophilum]|uniref:Ankyrin n=1 Tax=Cladobotryum mycophilum TaxID=491253 RepID=A0ABR0SGV6_9HYPO
MMEEEQDGVSALTVLSWLKMVNSPDNNHDPRKFSKEDQRLREFRQRHPDYSIAAVSWPRYASRHWSVLEFEITELFTTSEKRFNFAQWALEYAREKYPATFQSAFTSSRSHVVELANQLCDGKVGPFHMAAILGIPDLCRILVEKKADNSQSGIFGTPIYCALAGPTVMTAGTTPTKWTDVFNHNIDDERIFSVRILLLTNPSCDFTYKVEAVPDNAISTNRKNYHLYRVTLAGLAFWFSAHCKDMSVFDQIMGYGAQLDDNVLLVLENIGALLPQVKKPKLQEALTSALDFSLGPFFATPSLCEMKFHHVVDKKIVEFNLDMSFEPGTLLKQVTDEVFAMTVTSAIAGDQKLCLARLASDVRFKPNMPLKKAADGTIAHLAVSGDHFDIVNVLIKAGGDFTIVDEQGRTPLMVAESTRMLELMILKHGLPTTDVDCRGRNLWHFFAATDDNSLTDWLCENDPQKVINMQALTNYQWTPLDEANNLIHTAKTQKFRETALQPRVLCRILSEMKKCSIKATPDFDVHLAVSWGSVQVVDDLVAIGADFRKVDNHGNTVLHHLNSTATPELIRRLSEILGPEPQVGNDLGQSAAETIIDRTLEAYAVDDYKWRGTGHPACNTLLREESFREILTPDVINFRNSWGHGIWVRVCDMSVNTMYQARRMPSIFRARIFASTGIALRVLINMGAMREYEEESGHTAVELLRMKHRMKTYWEVKDNPCLDLVLQNSSQDLLDVFYQTEDAFILLEEAWSTGTYDIVGFLARTGLPLHAQHAVFENLSFIEMILSERRDEILTHIRHLLNTKARKYIIARKHDIYKVMVRKETPLRGRKLLMLLKKGLDPNPELAECFDVAMLMLRHGADPSLGRRGFNAFIAAAAKTDLTLMAEIVSILQDQHPDFQWDCEYEDIEGITFNALQIAAYSGHDRMLLLLLQTPLNVCINNTTSHNLAAPAHLAAARGSVECLQVLQSRDANMQVLDEEHHTPAQVALEHRHLSVVRFLQQQQSSSSSPLTHEFASRM